MIKSVKPGKLVGLSDSQIESRLEQLFECPVEYEDYVMRIYCVEQYDSTGYLLKDMRRLSHLGRVACACRHGRAFVQLQLNEEARDVISGARRARDAAQTETLQTTIQ